MNDILKFIEEMRQDTSTNYKLSVLEKYKDVNSVIKLLQYTYESRFNYYMTKLPDYEPTSNNVAEEEFIWELLDSLRKREFTGNSAKELVKRVCMELRPELVEVLQLILNRNLDLGVDTKSINKVIPNLISSTAYMRCTSSLDEKLIQKFESQEQGFYTQLKCDGSFVYVLVHQNERVELLSRNGTMWYSPSLEKDIISLPSGVYMGEALIKEGETYLVRKLGNGLLNKLIKGDSSLDTIEVQKGKDSKAYKDKVLELKSIDEKLDLILWDMLSHEEFVQEFSTTPYLLRYQMLQAVLYSNTTQRLSLVPTVVHHTIPEAQQYAKELMSQGYEGVIIKTFGSTWKSGTNKDMVKIKAELSCDLLCIDVVAGNGKYVDKIGALVCKSADDKIVVNVGSGFTDEDRMQPDDFYLDKIIEVKYNDKVDSKSKDGVWSLFLPVFMGIRFDKNEADKFEEIL